MILLSVILLSVGAAFAVSDDNSTMAVDEAIQDDNALAIDPDDSSLSDDSIPETQSSVVTKDTFHDYFDESGTLKDDVSSDELIFEGDFTGLDVSYMTIGKSIKLSGNNVALNGVSFAVIADNVVIDGFNLIHSDYSIFTVYGVSGVTLSNNLINFKTLEGNEGYAIHADTVCDLKILNNTINYVGNTDGTVVNNAIRVTGDEDSEITSTNIVVDGNVFNIEIPSVVVGYDPETWATKALSEGIVFYYCDGVKFTNNRVDLKYNSAKGSYDTIYAVSVRGNAYNFESENPIVSSNVEIFNNTITAAGHNYIYALFVSAEDFNVSYNVINATSDVYYANAITIDGPASEGMINNNFIVVNSPKCAYGVYSYQYNGAIQDISYVNNTIIGNSYAVCGMEIFEDNPYIENNVISVVGNYSTGIVAGMKKNGTISNNYIVATGSNNGTDPTGDPLLPYNSVAVKVKGNTSIRNNRIESTGIGINLVKEGAVTIENNIIDVNNFGAVESYAIYSEIGNLTILNNEIKFTGNTTGAVVNNAIFVTGDDDKQKAAKNIVVKNNTFDIKLPSVAVGYDPDTWASTVMSEGIVFYYCENVTFTDNRVNLKYNNVNGYYDTLYVVSVKSDAYNYDMDDDYNMIYNIVSSNVLISNNTIVAEGHSYIYGVFVAADNFSVSDNSIAVSSDAYYANGVDVDSLSTNGFVKNNEISVTAPNSAYGIYSANWMGPVENVTYDKNTINVNAYAACGMELSEANPYISNNAVVAIGNYTYGIVASIKDNATLISNDIKCIGTETGETSTGDSLLPKTSLAISTKGDVLIKENNVTATGTGIKTLNGEVEIENNTIKTTGDYAIEATGSDLTVKNNYLAAKKGVGSNSIVSDKSVASENNVPEFKVIILAPSVSTEYIKGAVFSAYAYDENGDPISNIVISVAIDGVVYNATTGANGLVKFNFNPDAGVHDVVVSFAGNDVYGPKEVTSNIIVNQSASKVVAKTSSTVYLTTVKSGSYFTVKVTDINGKVLANKKVSITFNGKTKTYTTNANGVIKYKLSASKTGTYTLKMKFAGDNNYVASSATATIKITKQASKVTAAKKTFKAATKTKKYTVTLKDSKGKVIKNAKLIIKVNGKTYKATTNSKGKATFKITKLTKRGTFSARVKYVGNTYYKATSKTVKITVKR